MKRNLALVIGSFLIGVTALAQTPEVQNEQPPAARMTPTLEHGYTYLCGGIGSDESAQMKRAAAQYSLMLTFAQDSGAYLADIRVEIGAADGPPMLKATCDGPIMLLNFPQPGNYRIKASVAQHTQSKDVRIRSGVTGMRLELLWPRRLTEVPPPG